MTDSNVTAIRKPTSDGPSPDVLEERLHALRTQIWHVQGLCGLAVDAARYQEDYAAAAGGGSFAGHLGNALEGACEVLNHIAGALEPDVLMRPPSEEELAPEQTPSE